MYEKIYDVPMGGCISISLADLFLSYDEEKLFDDCPKEFKPYLYRIYVHDCFLLFDSKRFMKSTSHEQQKTLQRLVLARHRGRVSSCGRFASREVARPDLRKWVMAQLAQSASL